MNPKSKIEQLQQKYRMRALIQYERTGNMLYCFRHERMLDWLEQWAKREKWGKLQKVEGDTK